MAVLLPARWRCVKRGDITENEVGIGRSSWFGDADALVGTDPLGCRSVVGPETWRPKVAKSGHVLMGTLKLGIVAKGQGPPAMIPVAEQGTGVGRCRPRPSGLSEHAGDPAYIEKLGGSKPTELLAARRRKSERSWTGRPFCRHRCGWGPACSARRPNAR